METLNHNFNKILIIQTAFLGDVLLTLPLIHHLRRIFTSVDIDLIIRPDAAEVGDLSCDLNRVIIFDKKKHGLRNTINLIKSIRGKKYDLLISPHRSFRSSIISLLSGISKRIGFDKASMSFLYTTRVKYRSELHEIERNLSLISEFGKISNWKQKIPIKRINPSLNKKIRSLIKSEQRIICVAPFSEWFTKKYPEDYVVKLIQMIINSDSNVVLIGGKKDEEDAKKVSESFEANNRFLDLTGRLSIHESIELIDKCNLLISNDSSPTHMAMFTDSPVLTIYGSTIPEFGFYPFRSIDSIVQINDLYCKPCGIHGHKKCPQKHFRCMRELKPELVFEQVKKMLKSGRISL